MHYRRIDIVAALGIKIESCNVFAFFLFSFAQSSFAKLPRYRYSLLSGCSWEKPFLQKSQYIYFRFSFSATLCRKKWMIVTDHPELAASRTESSYCSRRLRREER